MELKGVLGVYFSFLTFLLSTYKMAHGVVIMNGNDLPSLPIWGQALCRHYILVTSAAGSRMLKLPQLSRSGDGGSARLSYPIKMVVEPSQGEGPSIFMFKGFPSIMDSNEVKKLDTQLLKK